MLRDPDQMNECSPHVEAHDMGVEYEEIHGAFYYSRSLVFDLYCVKFTEATTEDLILTNLDRMRWVLIVIPCYDEGDMVCR